MSDDPQRDLELIVRLDAVLDGLPTQKRLDMLELAWFITATTARMEALIIPGGFPEERARQVQHLRAMTDLVEADEPDLEIARLWQEGDIEGLRRHLRKVSDE